MDKEGKGAPSRARVDKRAPSRVQGKRAASRRLFGPKAQKAFLEHLAATCNASAAARATGWPPSTVHQRRVRDPHFAEGWRRAIAIAYDRLEEAVLAHALGKIEPVAFDPHAVGIVVTDPASAASVDASGVPVTANSTRAARRIAGIKDSDGSAGNTGAGGVALVDAQLALAILNRRAAGMRDGRERTPPRKATPDEVAQAINAKLDKLAQRLGHAR